MNIPLRAFARRLTALTVICLLAAGCHKPQSDPSAAAQAFFEQVFAGKLSEAYRSAAFGFQATQSEQLFAANAGEMGLKGAKSVSLTGLKQEGEIARLNAEITSASGKRLPLIVTMTNESGQWKLFALRSPRSIETGRSENRFTLVGKTTAFEDAARQPVPDERTIRKLIREAMSQFQDALRDGSFKEFYAYVSDAWQAQLTERQLKTAFQSFVDQRIDLTPIANLEPKMDVPPQITSEGLLLLNGHYESRPYQVCFVLKFIYELPDWKLFGIDVTLRPEAPPK